MRNLEKITLVVVALADADSGAERVQEGQKEQQPPHPETQQRVDVEAMQRSGRGPEVASATAGSSRGLPGWHASFPDDVKGH